MYVIILFMASPEHAHCYCIQTVQPFVFLLQVLVRIKENEIEYLHKEISCLRNELQFLNTVQCVCVLVSVNTGTLVNLTFLDR